MVSRHFLERHAGCVSEQLRGVTLAEVGLVVSVGTLVAESHDSVDVVVGVGEGMGEVLGLDTESAAAGLTSGISLRDQRSVKASGRESVLRLVQRFALEDLT